MEGVPGREAPDLFFRLFFFGGKKKFSVVFVRIDAPSRAESIPWFSGGSELFLGGRSGSRKSGLQKFRHAPGVWKVFF